MPLISMREMLDHAAEAGYGIPAFNVNNLEQVQAVMAAAEALARSRPRFRSRAQWQAEMEQLMGYQA